MPEPPDPVKLLAAVLWQDGEALTAVLARAADLWGAIDFCGPDRPFNLTDYYEAEMGERAEEEDRQLYPSFRVGEPGRGEAGGHRDREHPATLRRQDRQLRRGVPGRPQGGSRLESSTAVRRSTSAAGSTPTSSVGTRRDVSTPSNGPSPTSRRGVTTKSSQRSARGTRCSCDGELKLRTRRQFRC